MRIHKLLMPAAAIVTFLGTVFVARTVGAWQTSGRDMIDPTAPLTSADIRGWMTLEYLVERLDLSQQALYDLLGLPASVPPSTPLKDLEDVIEVSTVRALVAGYLGEAAPEHEDHETSPADTPAPDTPTLAPTRSAPPTATPVSAPQEHVPGQGRGPGGEGGIGTGPTPLPPGQILPAASIVGRMTLQQVSEQCGVELDALYAALQLPQSVPASTVLRDLRSSTPAIEVIQVRDAVAALQGN
jgi:hypothetical protein